MRDKIFVSYRDDVEGRTHKNLLVAWEIEQAKELKKRIIAVKISKNYNTPINLYGIEAKWALDFSKTSILKAMNY